MEIKLIRQNSQGLNPGDLRGLFDKSSSTHERTITLKLVALTFPRDLFPRVRGC